MAIVVGISESLNIEMAQLFSIFRYNHKPCSVFSIVQYKVVLYKGHITISRHYEASEARSQTITPIMEKLRRYRTRTEKIQLLLDW